MTLNNVEELENAARAAMKRAYAPHSRFRVGAVVKSGTGRIYSGCNIENPSYGLTICAERCAIFKMVSEGEREIKELFVVTDSEKLLFPCGACRQVIAEFSSKSTKVHISNRQGQRKESTVDELIPDCFSLEERADDGPDQLREP